jgi:hypothetical protein
MEEVCFCDLIYRRRVLRLQIRNLRERVLLLWRQEQIGLGREVFRLVGLRERHSVRLFGRR